MNEFNSIPHELPLVPMKGAILFPYALGIVRISGLKEEVQAFTIQNPSGLTATIPLERNYDLNNLVAKERFTVGTLAYIEGARERNNALELSLRGMSRIRILEIEKRGNLYFARVEALEDMDDMDDESCRMLMGKMMELAKEIASFFKGTEETIRTLSKTESLDELIYAIIPPLTIPQSKKQKLLELSSLKERGLQTLDYMIQQRETFKLQAEIAGKLTESANKNYRENVLREQLRVIRQELQDTDFPEEDDLQAKIEKSEMPDEIRKAAFKELRKLNEQVPNSPEIRIIQSYLELLLELPWTSEDSGPIDLEAAARVLDSRHYGLEKVKTRIIQHLAVMKLKKGKKGSILLLTGPPGTGKTSLGKSIAEALNRRYVRVSLGGVRDEAEIRGHRRTYVGALPGRIIQNMKKAGTRNPVFVLDEVDKLQQGISGDPAGALLEVLDPEQNNSFSDHYLELPYDLSDVFFVATANSTDTIPAPLLDRMEVINLSSYTNPEKFHIARKHLVPAVLEEHGLTPNHLVLEDSCLHEIIEHYTREAGVRNLKRMLAETARVVSEKVVREKEKLPIRIDRAGTEAYLDNQKVRHEKAGSLNPPGVVTGMAWTAAGGEILFVECTSMPGKGNLITTGQLGDVMKESAKISLSLVRSRLAMHCSHFAFKEQDIHIHIPSGAVPKDGPSAGITLLCALASLVTGRPVDSSLAMTGEVTLRGRVMPVGGIKEKVIAAHRAGIKRILIPLDNKKDLKELPEEIREEMVFITVEHIQDVLKEALSLDIQKDIQYMDFLKKEKSGENPSVKSPPPGL